MRAARAALTLGASALLLLGNACSKKKPSGGERSPQPTPPPILPRKNYDTARLFNGTVFHSRLESSSSGRTALATLSSPDSYLLDLSLRIAWPEPAVTPGELIEATPELSTLLPQLPELLKEARPSSAFATLLQNKEKFLRTNLGSLQKLPYRDSLFDCQTILEVPLPQGGPGTVLVQAIMNVNTDGSDGDRNLDLEKLSPLFQPQTNYRWTKQTSRPNPCLQETEAHVAAVAEKLASGTLTPEQRSECEKEQTHAKATLEELKRWSFLVGTADPFIVLPSFMVGKIKGQPGIGDYAIVIAQGTLYPAVLGDMGPSSKIGEASLRLCRTIDEKSGADHRPASRPEIVYLVFPGSADKPLAAPDYAHWSRRCHELWKSLGGSETAPWHEWTPLEKPWPTPTPSPEPSADTASASPAGTNPATLPSSPNRITQPFTPNPSPSSSLPSAPPKQ